MDDPSRPWSGRPHAELAELVRELLLIGHLIDRAGMPQVLAHLDRAAMAEIAIDEWMGASPIYTKRVQQLLRFEGDDVETIFKGMQFDIGAPPEFLDFRYTVHDDTHGEFELAHCGALADVEPMGEEFVFTMCHDIEDPTFDATAVATNPRARMRPVHRPPREPADRVPHCRWEVTIVEEAEPLPFPPQAARMSASTAASVPLATRPQGLAADDGAERYDFPLDSDLVAERFSSATLAAVAEEVCLQHHLLSRSFLLAVADRLGDGAVEVGIAQLTGIAGLGARRLAAALGARADLAGVAAVLGVHPLLQPRTYVAASVSASGNGEVDHNLSPASLTLSLGPCPALDEPDGLTWPSLIVEHDDRPLRALVEAVLPTAALHRNDPAPGSSTVATWTITDDPTAQPAAEMSEVRIMEFSTGSSFRFERRG